ncbi:styrene monooxygenase/indole monooxygenase family protein [Actinomadura parmotrematis]|uniref:FAD-binding oxidoreductase n=1 Tax=Actinomadura parmotrematis TaxID=2864039 RepID=A0ABS7FQV2_9ACTN|nr:styrene monooxygenase/indole monooxygenase family protein [Actinomadura parmotrematis]MBW8482777.1 FAD-binding oxidoreductase [Actinomadura parmotrematis]
MRKILIIGAGQAGLQLALVLAGNGYDVTVMSDRSGEDIAGGRPTSTQCVFHPALDIERAHGLDLWPQAPQITGQRVTVAGPGGQALLETYGPFARPAASVDQRVKMPAWMDLLEERGGRVQVHPVLTSELPALARRHDLTVIAAGKGELVELFDRDDARSPYRAPQRRLAAIYLHGMAPWPADPRPHVRITALPGVGELFYMPGLTRTGACDIVLCEAVPGGPLDVWPASARTSLTPDGHLERLRELTAEWAPWEHRLLAAAEPTDARAALYGGYPPTVRRPVAVLDGVPLLGLADTVVLNDPATGQGANNACHAADIYARAILERGDGPFDAGWMQATFDAYWDTYARFPTAFTNMMIGPLPEHVQQVLGVASADDGVAARFAACYTDPPTTEEWIMDAGATGAYLASVTGQPAG